MHLLSFHVLFIFIGTISALFKKAISLSPCILFIDEIDALAKNRGSFNSHDEREQTLNALLTEMDGFDTKDTGVLVIAATNRPSVLDKALLRSGRFDFHIHVPMPDLQGSHSTNLVLFSTSKAL